MPTRSTLKRCPKCGRDRGKKTILCGACYREKLHAETKGKVCPKCGEAREKFNTRQTCLHCANRKKIASLTGPCSSCGDVRVLKNGARQCGKCKYAEAAKHPVACRECGRVRAPYSRGLCRSCYLLPASRMRKYGLTDDTYREMVREQQGRCAICAGKMQQTPNVDHDHATGTVRGLLCYKCNVGLGSFGDDPERLRAAAKYVEAHRARKVA